MLIDLKCPLLVRISRVQILSDFDAYDTNKRAGFDGG